MYTLQEIFSTFCVVYTLQEIFSTFCVVYTLQEIFNPPPQLSRLGIQVSLAIIIHLFVWAVVGWVTLPFFYFCFLKASVLCTCISMYVYV